MQFNLALGVKHNQVLQIWKISTCVSKVYVLAAKCFKPEYFFKNRICKANILPINILRLTMYKPIGKCFIYIIIEQNHRMSWVRRGLKDHPVPTPLTWAETPFTKHVAQSPIPPALEHFLGWGIHNYSGEPVPVPHHPHSKELLPDV